MLRDNDAFDDNFHRSVTNDTSRATVLKPWRIKPADGLAPAGFMDQRLALSDTK